MLTLKAPFLLTFIVVLIIVSIINFIAREFLSKKENKKRDWKKLILLVLTQSILITLLLNVM